MIKYQARLHKEGHSYWTQFPDLPGCFSEGLTKEEVLENSREALSLYLEESRDPKWKVPIPKTRRGKNYFWIIPYEDVGIPLMIRQARLKHGLSQRQMASRLGITIQQLQKLETPGKSNPTIKTLAAISRALNGELEIKLVA